MFNDLRRHAIQVKTQLIHKRRCRAHQDRLTPLSQRFQGIFDDLRENGAAITTLDKIAAPRTAEALAGLDRLFAQTDQLSPRPGEYAVHASKEQIIEETDVIRWGLDPELLALVENYIGLPIAYRGLTVRRDCADGRLTGTRMWHRDNEDASILKIIVYLNDVDLEAGPFQYIPAPFSPPEWRIRTIESSRVTDADMERLVPRTHWVPCTGPKGTVIFADPCRLYHRGIVPLQRDRKAAFFCYNSAEPLNPAWCQALFDREQFLSQAAVSPLQKAALDYNY
jgi:hypothetical protein